MAWGWGGGEDGVGCAGAGGGEGKGGRERSRGVQGKGMGWSRAGGALQLVLWGSVCLREAHRTSSCAGKHYRAPRSSVATRGCL